MIARDVMTDRPVTVDVESTAAEAAAILRDLEIRHLPVVERGALVGIVSDRDLRSLDLQGLLEVEDIDSLRAQFSTPVVSLMSPEVICVHPETELGEIVALMIETKVGAIPVIDPPTREVVGIVSYIDVLRAFQETLED